jgi:hypothetical protein
MEFLGKFENFMETDKKLSENLLIGFIELSENQEKDSTEDLLYD